ncbi:hypothetical protein D3C80_1743510 [compost metagenome]
MVEEQIDPLELFGLAALLLRGQQVLPGIDTTLSRPHWPVQGLGATADLGEVPIGLQAAQQQAAEHNGKPQPAHGQVNSPTFRHCENPRRLVEKHRWCGLAH